MYLDFKNLFKIENKNFCLQYMLSHGESVTKRGGLSGSQVLVFSLEEGGEICCPFVKKEDGESSKSGEENQENQNGHPCFSKQWKESVTVTRRKAGV